MATPGHGHQNLLHFFVFPCIPRVRENRGCPCLERADTTDVVLRLRFPNRSRAGSALRQQRRLVVAPQGAVDPVLDIRAFEYAVFDGRDVS